LKPLDREEEDLGIDERKLFDEQPEMRDAAFKEK